MLSFYGGDLLAPRPISKLEDHPLLAVRQCLSNTFAVTPPCLEAILHTDCIHVFKHLLCLIFLAVFEVFLPSA
jgi:hypothetical protein